jgi:hypothetical protein
VAIIPVGCKIKYLQQILILFTLYVFGKPVHVLLLLAIITEVLGLPNGVKLVPINSVRENRSVYCRAS